MIVSLIAALNEERAIGINGAMPWHISEDLKYFKAVTQHHAVIMGRRTFESVGSRPLPNRHNIVLSRTLSSDDLNFGLQDSAGSETRLSLVSNLEEALALCAGQSEVFVMGGGKLYSQALPLADKLYLTEVKMQVDGADTFFPAFDESEFEVEKEGPWQHSAKGLIPYRFLVLRRKRS